MTETIIVALISQLGTLGGTLSGIVATAKLALVLCIALDKKFEKVFYFD